MRYLMLAATLTTGTIGFVAPAQAQNIAPPQLLTSPAPAIPYASRNYSYSPNAFRLAAPAAIRRRATLRDRQGRYIGWVESVREDGVVVRYGSRRAKLPFEDFGVGEQGLHLSITEDEFHAQAAQRPYRD